MNTPILLLVFNRPQQATRILESIRQQQPAQLFIAADGPRHDKPGEATLCRQTRDAILQRLDWNCEVHTLFRDRNLGCAHAVSSAIDWFFSQVEEGIILEDDCLPDTAFYPFCEALLERYRHDTSIMHIGGTNYQAGLRRGNASYYFSRYAHIWGWATWKRAWKYYDFTLRRYKDVVPDHLPFQFKWDLQSFYEQKMDTWDTQWFLTVLFNKGITITPNTNLIRNIGYGKAATHTRTEPVWFRKMTYGTIRQLTHPDEIAIDEEADAYTMDTVFKCNPLFYMIKKMIRNNTLLYNLYKRIS
ncbi:glycosyltransferase family A protein [Chitinophaga filiformis]|uniref:Glycosyltransferase family 2 protein n=1 Tax=Chitinophaga filiformis TaxID=104663 RepID=A0ABY4HYU9_CHIFI|nr:glycosyltransferase family A protein [Chitinophaga filiformis]UPK68785.1 glycosyltransferase family 2 protein [Chitinophaga filiformis]